MERNTNEKVTILIASVKEREAQLKTVLSRISTACRFYTTEIHVVLNWYNEIPAWIRKPSWWLELHSNSTNKNAHDAIWSYVPNDGYVFICDDDLLYPSDFFYKLIAAIERHERRAVVTAHGSNIILPAGDYMDSRVTYGFSDRRERDIFNDICGVGCCAFHTSALQPTLQDFPVPFMRDIYFSLLCKKNDVPIVNVQRPSNWVNPLQTPGSTVYEETLNNKNLRDLKNRVMKEQLLPALHCNQRNEDNKYTLIVDYRYDSRLMNTTLSTLDDTSDCNIVVFTDELKDYDFSSEQYTPKQKVLVQYVTPDERSLGRMGSKVLCCYRFVCGLPNGSKVLISDADMMFLRNPFGAFEKEFDLGVTSRCEPHHYPLNAGIIFMRVSDQLKDYLRFVIENLYTPNWPGLAAYQKRFGHDPDDKDWNWDQDALCTTYLMRDKIKERFGVDVVNLGFYWNMCPHADGTPEQIASGKAKLLRAYHSESVAVLHLKSKLRELLFDGILI